MNKYKRYNNKNKVLNFINKIGSLLLKNKNTIFKEGICVLFEKYKIPECNLTTKNNMYKEFNTILQYINLFRNINLFSIKFSLYVGCSICNNPKITENYLNPCIEITKNYLISKKI